MRECSLHFDFVNAEGKLDLNKADTLMEMALKLGIHTFNTYWDQEVYPEKDAEDQEFADQIHADHYAKDAMATVRYAEQILKQ